jgi:hypothetical protein
MRRRSAHMSAPKSSFTGFRFPPDVITVAVRWYLRYGLSYRDVEELLAERCMHTMNATPPSGPPLRAARRTDPDQLPGGARLMQQCPLMNSSD